MASGTDGQHLFRGDLGIGIGHGEDDRLVGHRGDHVLGHRALDRDAEEDVGALHGVGQRPGVGVDGVGALPLVHALLAPAIDHPGVVDRDAVFRPRAHRLDQFEGGDARRAGAAQHQLDVLQLAAGDLAGVDQAGAGDDRRAVLVVVEHRDVEQVLQLGLDAEALGALDVLEIDAAVGDADILDDGNDLVGVLRRDLHVHRIDVGEALEQHRLAFHHRLGLARAPRSPRPRMAVPLVITATRLPLEVYS